MGVLILATGVGLALLRRSRPWSTPAYAGSSSCRPCHETFYDRWSTSRHGLAMQAFTSALAREQLSPQTQDIVVGQHRFRADLKDGHMREMVGTDETRHPMANVLGGKHVYYFLTPWERGRLQVLPVAYDRARKEWYDVAQSALRHFADVGEQAVPWTAPEFTFNASCHGCHVSQLASNYDRATDAYHSTWAEPGINCETCHGPGEAHIRAATAAGSGHPMAELGLISIKGFTRAQKNDLCASCHARLRPIAESFQPGAGYFDAFDLVGIEDRDFYPDGRDLGENYTFTSWRQSPCARSGQLDCMHCHTSSGRYRFSERAQANEACASCHADKLQRLSAHAHHPADKIVCVDCHMPKTEFARMVRTDHSMRPPAPAATLTWQSPNACNLCHEDRDAAWSDGHVRAWYAHDYQAAVMHRGRLIAAARQHDWSQLPAMLAETVGPGRDEVTAVALLRLLRACPSDSKRPAVLAAMRDASPWVRAAAAEAVGEHPSEESVKALLALTRDDPVHLPRVRAAAALVGVSEDVLSPDDQAVRSAAIRVLERALESRPDDFASQFDLGRLYADLGVRASAIAAYEVASKLRPDRAEPFVNLSLLYDAEGRRADAESALRRALALEPDNAAALLDLGMLLGAQGRLAEAETSLRAALRADPKLAAAAYNLAVVVSRNRPAEAVTWSRRASELAPESAKYAYTWAFYLANQGDLHEAIAVLRRARERSASNTDSLTLLADLLGRTGQKPESAASPARGDARLAPAGSGHPRAHGGSP